MSIVLIDATRDSLTVSWTDRIAESEDPAKKYGVVHYVLQYCVATPSNVDDGESGPTTTEYITLSDSLRSNQARKKNLVDPNQNGFLFRVGSRIISSDAGPISDSTSENKPTYGDITNWITHTEPFHLLSKEQEIRRMDAPTVRLGGSNASLLLSWSAPVTDSVSSSLTYEIQMRENSGGLPWTTIAAAFGGTEVRKNHLSSPFGYQFRIRPNVPTTTPPLLEEKYCFSSPSEPVMALSFSNSGIRHLLSSYMLLSNRTPKNVAPSSDKSLFPTVPIEDALGGKEFILFYVSAHWCGPCRQFTPKLAQWYNQQTTTTSTNFSPVEVVFVSADHDMKGFTSYYQTMPWTAIPYDDPIREQLMASWKVRGIPRLVVYDSRTGTIVEENAVGKPLDLSRWRKK
jgi:thiol-disulfide isomerase/thioredoxin